MYSSLPQLFVSFFKLGATAFGGPAMVPYIGKLAVEQKRWINDQTFRDGVLFAKQFLEQRRCKPPFGFQHYFSRKAFIQRRPIGCVKAIAMSAPTSTFHVDAAK